MTHHKHDRGHLEVETTHRFVFRRDFGEAGLCFVIVTLLVNLPLLVDVAKEDLLKESSHLALRAKV